MVLMTLVLGKVASFLNFLSNNLVSVSSQVSLFPLDLVDGSLKSKSQLSTLDVVAAGKSWGDVDCFFLTW